MAEPVSLQVVVATAPLSNAFSSLGFELDPRHGYALRLWNEIRSRSRLVCVTTTARDFPPWILPPFRPLLISTLSRYPPFNVRFKRLRFSLAFAFFSPLSSNEGERERERFDKFVKRITTSLLERFCQGRIEFILFVASKKENISKILFLTND